MFATYTVANPTPTASSNLANPNGGHNFDPNLSPFVNTNADARKASATQPLPSLPFPLATSVPGPFTKNESVGAEANSTTSIRNGFETEIMVMAEVRSYFQLACMVCTFKLISSDMADAFA